MSKHNHDVGATQVYGDSVQQHCWRLLELKEPKENWNVMYIYDIHEEWINLQIKGSINLYNKALSSYIYIYICINVCWQITTTRQTN